MIKISDDIKIVVSALYILENWFGPKTRLSDVPREEFARMYRLFLG